MTFNDSYLEANLCPQTGDINSSKMAYKLMGLGAAKQVDGDGDGMPRQRNIILLRTYFIFTIYFLKFI